MGESATGTDWLALGRRLLAEGKPRRAAEAFMEAVARAPEDTEAGYALGETWANLGRLEAARAELGRVLALDPNHLAAHAALATMSARVGDADDARRHAEAVLAQAPGHPIAVTALANLALRERDFVQAEARVRALLSGNDVLPLNRAAALALLGEALNGQSRAAEAFAAWTAANALHARLQGDGWRARAEARREGLERLIQYYEAGPDPLPPLAEAPSPARGHVFLTGFLRSGTTLAGQVLAAHPDVSTLDERTTIAPIAQSLLGGPDGAAGLTRAGPEHRRAYWDAVRLHGVEPEGRVVVDKLPMHVAHLPVIARLFPEAQVLFVRRDPRDVVLGGFRRLFRANADTCRMTSLEGAARTYDQAMRLTEVCRERLPIAFAELRYEALIADFDGETLRLCGLLGLDWTPDLNDFAAKAAARPIGTPSANQVRRGLFDGGGQWRAYEEQLAPVMPILQPWIERLGYA